MLRNKLSLQNSTKTDLEHTMWIFDDVPSHVLEKHSSNFLVKDVPVVVNKTPSVIHF